jgi:hypothetical protein
MSMEPSGRLEGVTRRDVLSGSLAVAAGGMLAGEAGASLSAEESSRESIRTFLADYVVPPAAIEQFLDPAARVWARFHPAYGYLLRNSSMRDGVDGASTLARYEPGGQRKQVNFPTDPCRIHTYGDSFTQGHQVSDGETWQEVLAAHYCEPIRNFGIGGFGVYQAAMRLLEIEQRGDGAEHLILTIWGDDHFRSIYPWRWLAFPQDVLPSLSGEMFHANPWIHAALDLESGELVDRPNACPDEATLSQLSDLDWLEETFAEDPVVQLLCSRATGHVVDRAQVEAVAAVLGEPVDLKNEAAVRSTSQRLLHRYGVRVGMRVIDRLHAFAQRKGKRLMVVLSYPVAPSGTAAAARRNTTRPTMSTGIRKSFAITLQPKAFRALTRCLPMSRSLTRFASRRRTMSTATTSATTTHRATTSSPTRSKIRSASGSRHLLRPTGPKPSG